MDKFEREEQFELLVEELYRKGDHEKEELREMSFKELDDLKKEYDDYREDDDE
ncbi:hypothetical protein REJ83_018380 [Clostridioides difficile]|nr:hypothetical protein [Clostridioides difficile]